MSGKQAGFIGTLISIVKNEGGFAHCQNGVDVPSGVSPRTLLRVDHLAEGGSRRGVALPPTSGGGLFVLNHLEGIVKIGTMAKGTKVLTSAPLVLRNTDGTRNPLLTGTPRDLEECVANS